MNGYQVVTDCFYLCQGIGLRSKDLKLLNLLDFPMQAEILTVRLDAN